MSTVSIVGGLGGGKSTALGLLYESLVWYAAQNKRFQFSVAPESACYLSYIANKLHAGEFPEKTDPGIRNEVKLVLQFKGIFGWKKPVIIDTYDLSGEDIERVLERMRAAKTMQEIISDLRGREVIQGLLDSEVFIFVVNATSCDLSENRESMVKKAENDFLLARFWAGIEAYKEKTKWNVKGLSIIFAKYDEARALVDLGDVDYYTQGNAHPLARDAKPVKARRKTAPFETTLKKYLPQTWATLIYDTQRISEQNLRYFRSGIIMKRDGETGEPSIALPLTFTADEYVRLVKWLSSI